MNDRLKFKVWDKKNKKFLELVTRDELCDTWISIDNTGVYQVERKNETDETFFTDITDNVDVIFSTGLKDLNGKLIYEGDIVRLDDDNCIVQFHKEYDRSYGRIEFILIDRHPKYPTIYIPSVANEGEIIGNTYTTPELLEEQCK